MTEFLTSVAIHDIPRDMPLSDVGLRDPAMVGAARYERHPLDFYPSPISTVKSLLSVVGDDLPTYAVWEPFCGDGAVARGIMDMCRDLVSTDIRAYDGFDPDGLFDFFSIRTDEEKEFARLTWELDPTPERFAAYNDMKTLADITALKGFTPDVIITNPPYGEKGSRVDLAGNCLRHAIKLMTPVQGIVMFLCRHEWDAAKKRRDIFDHPSYAMKITLRHRPRWIAGSEGAPRFYYAWYVFDTSRTSPTLRSENHYAD